jgi:hypothetical protein
VLRCARDDVLWKTSAKPPPSPTMTMWERAWVRVYCVSSLEYPTAIEPAQ